MEPLPISLRGVKRALTTKNWVDRSLHLIYNYTTTNPSLYRFQNKALLSPDDRVINSHFDRSCPLMGISMPGNIGETLKCPGLPRNLKRLRTEDLTNR